MVAFFTNAPFSGGECRHMASEGPLLGHSGLRSRAESGLGWGLLRGAIYGLLRGAIKSLIVPAHRVGRWALCWLPWVCALPSRC